MDVHTHAIAGALDVDGGHTGTFQVFAQELADLDVLSNVLGVLLVGVPVRLPIGGNAQAEAHGVNFLTH